jgi:hypothetical protein
MQASRIMVVLLGAWVGLAALTRDDATPQPQKSLPPVEPPAGSRRLEAARETDPAALARLARDPDPWVRANALRALPDPALLRERLAVETDPMVRALIERLMEGTR